jgi:hypothetical protein
LLAASALGRLGERSQQRRLRELATNYLLFGYALYMVNTSGVRDQLSREELAQLMVEVATEITAADYGLWAPAGTGTTKRRDLTSTSGRF